MSGEKKEGMREKKPAFIIRQATPIFTKKQSVLVLLRDTTFAFYYNFINPYYRLKCHSYLDCLLDHLG